MAELPKKEASGMPRFGWLIIIVLILLLVWLFAEACPRQTAGTGGEPAEEETATRAEPSDPRIAPPGVRGGAISDIDTLLASTERSRLTGRRVEIVAARVNRVVGDRAFTIGTDRMNEILVLPLEEALARIPPEGRLGLQEGQVVGISGTISPLPPAEQVRQEWHLPTMTDQELNEAEVYIAASRVVGAVPVEGGF